MTVHSEIRREIIGTHAVATGERIRQLVIRQLDHGWGAHLGAVVTDMTFALWRLRHRDASFGEFQAHLIEARLRWGGPQVTPGAPDYRTGSSGPADAAEFRRRGLKYFDWFRGRNLRRDMTCIDYGCGSLRVGQHFIEYLDAGRYLGLDIVDNFYREGLAMTSGQVISRRQPRFLAISDETLDRARETRPDLVFSTAVVQHVPPQELSSFFENVIATMHERTTAIVHFKTAPVTTRIAVNAWAHSPVSLIAAIAEIDPDMHVRIEDAGNSGSHFRRDALIFSRNVQALSQWLRPLSGQSPFGRRTLNAASA